MAAVAVLFAAATLVLRATPVIDFPDMVLTVGSPYMVLIALLGLALTRWCRRTLLSVVALIVVAASVGIQVSWYYLGRPAGLNDRHTEIRVFSANILKGQADPEACVRIATENADVITVAELTPQAVERFARAGLNRVFPYSHLLPAPGAGGIGMWSRYPLTVLSAPRHRNVAMPAVQLSVPGVTLEPVLASTHVMSPVAGDENTVSDWRIGMAGARAQLDNFARAAGAGAVIVGGDYNSTPDMRQFRDLLTNGYRDAVHETGAGFAPTFPADTWYPPLITIDHVLTRNAVTTSVSVVSVPGSDHRALLATIQVPQEPVANPTG